MATCTAALDVGGPRLQSQDVVLVQLELGGVLDGDDPLVVGDRGGQHVQRRGLARAGAAADEDVHPSADAGVEEVPRGRAEGAEGDQVLGPERVSGELADRQDGAVQRDRRDDGVDAAAVGQAGVHHGAGFVDAASDPGHDLLDRPAQVSLVRELGRGEGQPAAGLDVDPAGAVDHDLA